MRDGLVSATWLEERIAASEREIALRQTDLMSPSGDPSYRPQFVENLSRAFLTLLLRHYSRGDPIRSLAQYIEPLLDTWEEAERLGQAVWTEAQHHSRHAWSLNLDHYIRCFWLVGLALALDLPDSQWMRLLMLIGNEGEDALLDSVIASRQRGRRIGAGLCHPKPYQRLWDAAKAPAAQQARAMADFVGSWYADFDRAPKAGLSRLTNVNERPYWYEYHTVEGAYFGYWCVEAVAAVKAFSLDDSLCLGLPHYPGDLLRPEGPSTHPVPTVAVQARAEQSVAQPTGIKDRLRKKLFDLRTRA